jgi:RNA polymerase sigma factor (sigma-70 family)
MSLASDREPSVSIARMLKDRSPGALEALILAHGQSIHRVAYSIVGDFHAAEDITSETLLTAWRRIDSLRDDGRIRPWLLSIAARNALQHLRQRTPRGNVVDALDGTEQMEARTVSRLTVRAAMEQLPDRMRAVITLRYLADLSVDEISRVIGRSRNTVKTELRLGLQRLREQLAEEDLKGVER